jgi:transcriptional regulator with GAF, ATPase, and Fis domain
MIEHFLERLARRGNKVPRHVEADFLDEAMKHDWPGNVRELENAVERAVILAQGGRLQLHEPLASSPTRVDPPEEPGGSTVVRSLEEVERLHIQRMLELAAGVVEGANGAARMLGLKPSTLRARMRKLGVVRGNPTAR